MKNKEWFGNRLKLAREMRGFTLRSLAEKLGVSRTLIYHYEKHKMIPSSDMIIKLSKLLNVKPAFFFKSNFSDWKLHGSIYTYRVKNPLLADIRVQVEKRLELEEIVGLDFNFHWNSLQKLLKDMTYKNIQFPTPINTQLFLETNGVMVIRSKYSEDIFTMMFSNADVDGIKIPIVVLPEKGKIKWFRERYKMLNIIREFLFDKTSIGRRESDFVDDILMPYEKLLYLVGPVRKKFTEDEFKRWLNIFGVSSKVLLDRLINVKIINSNVLRNLRRFVIDVEPDIPEPEDVDFKEMLLQRIESEGLVSQSKFMELLD